MSLRRRAISAGCVAALLYSGFMLCVLIAAGSIKPLHQALPAALLGMATAFAVGALAFGLIPHLLSTLMDNSSSTFDLINKASLATALVSILIGVIAALMLIFGVSQAIKPLLVAVTLFAGSAAALCSLRFFFTNRNSE
ncbi:hypothetical protein AAFN46_00365 [Pseudomonas sp. CAU 1711]|uniref:hypothetical protein n=1 Tax=Pseudomonas sp. CAU 1711 TaxID=3140356 RepID=UPI00326065FD